jgi:peptidoglycan LD-endopeptidase CwlK
MRAEYRWILGCAAVAAIATPSPPIGDTAATAGPAYCAASGSLARHASPHLARMIAAIVLYFAIATAALALILLPQVRAQAIGWAQRMISGGTAVRRRAADQGQRSAGQMVRAVGGASSAGASWVSEHRRWLIGAAVILPAAPLVPFALRGFLKLEGYDHRISHEMNEKVAGLLQGEQLVPPPPVPPELFMTAEVEQARPLTRGASRQWELLEADFRQRLLIVFKLMRDQHGYDMVLLEGYRSPERQAQLAALGPQMTRAGAFESFHQFGLAADCAFMRDGRIVISEQDAWAARGYGLYGEVARSVGLTWGGGWTSIKDFGHVELRRDGVLQRRSGS